MNRMLQLLGSYRKRILYFLLLLIILGFAFCLPNPLFSDPTSTIIEDSKGRLLSARIAQDGQWRFPETDSLPPKFITAITYFEDEYFYYHPGFNPVSMVRATKQNILARRVVSGGSTLTMQTIRLSRKGKSRSFFEKAKEIVLAMRLELAKSKQEIINLYASHAPFGGNVVGLEAAAWRYFGRKPTQLSWGEITTLAVLPNAPSLIYPGKNQEKLKIKRDRLLDKLFRKGEIDSLTCVLAQEEPLPNKAFAIPNKSPHLMDRIIKEGNRGKRIKTTVDLALQEKVNDMVDDYHNVLSQNEIHNIAVLVLEVETGKVLAYTGNTNCPEEQSGRNVDIITSPRSSGSILKPFLFTFMLQDGAILPNTLVSDIPTQIAGYSPKNFDETFDGVVPASEALARSLNIPAVRMLKDYGLENFYQNLGKLNFSTINKSANHYGLSIILGGAEVTLWDLGNAYMKMGQNLNAAKVFPKANFMQEKSLEESPVKKEETIFDSGALWCTFEALSTLNRPLQETGWQEFQSSNKVAWKTGTSFGHRDAWAVGVTSKYVVGVWAGNADGEGRPGLTGLSVAAPILFKVFKHLEASTWFEKPEWDLVKAKVCKQSGYLAAMECDVTEEILVPKKAFRTTVCPFHEIIHLDKTKQFRVSGNCYPVTEMESVSWFVLPPVQEFYYKNKNPFYKTLPPFKVGCGEETFRNMAVIYPKNRVKVFIPRQLDGSYGKTIFEITHRNPQSLVFWHIDDTFIGTTINEHKMELHPSYGNHKISLIDEQGENLSWNFEVLEK